MASADDAMRRAEALNQAGDTVQAEEVLRQLLGEQPDHAGALNALAAMALERGAFDEAIALFERALASRPQAPGLRANLGEAHRRAGRAREAIAHAERALALRPDHELAFAVLIAAHADLRDFAKARAAADAALAANPANTRALLMRAAANIEAHAAQAAIADLRAAMEREPDNAIAHTLLGKALAAAGHADGARVAHERAIALAPGSWDAHFDYGQTLRDLGRFDEAAAAFAKCLELRPHSARVWVNLTEVKRFREAGELDAMEASLAQAPPQERVFLHFALAKANDDLGRFSGASAHMLQGNALKRAGLVYDETATLAFFERIKRTFTPELLARLSGGGAKGELPIFVFGMPRSGTSLIEQIISSHPAVAAAGEIDLLDRMLLAPRAGAPYPDYAAQLSAADLASMGDAFMRELAQIAPGAGRITDKAPSTYFHVGLVHLAMPGAKLIHVSRNAVDTCLSCFSKLFSLGQDYSYDLTELGRYYRAYHSLMQHWRAVLPTDAFLDVRYEDVVADLEGQARRILDFCGLDWDARVLDFHRTERTVRTWSAQQVRQQIYGSSVARWRNYEAMLAPLLAELGDLAER